MKFNAPISGRIPSTSNFMTNLATTNKQSKEQCIPREINDDMNIYDAVNYSSSASCFVLSAPKTMVVGVLEEAGAHYNKMEDSIQIF